MSNLNKSQERLIINYQIRAPKVLCIDQNNTNVGVIPLSQAIGLASASGLDLVQVSLPTNKDHVPTCKIVDGSKYRYELSKKRKEADKKQREAVIKTKQCKMRPNTDVHDLEIKAKQVEKFLNEGCRVQVIISFKGREISHQEVANQTLETFMSFIPDMQMLGKPSFDRKDLTVFVGKRDSSSSVKAS